MAMLPRVLVSHVQNSMLATQDKKTLPKKGRKNRKLTQVSTSTSYLTPITKENHDLSSEKLWLLPGSFRREDQTVCFSDSM